MQRDGFGCETSAGDEEKNLHPLANRRMKAFDEDRRALARQTGLILLFDGEVGAVARRLPRSTGSHDEHSLADILTSGLTSLPPSR